MDSSCDRISETRRRASGRNLKPLHETLDVNVTQAVSDKARLSLGVTDPPLDSVHLAGQLGPVEGCIV